MTADELVTELIMRLEERLEGGFTPAEDHQLRHTLIQAARRMEAEDAPA